MGLVLGVTGRVENVMCTQIDLGLGHFINNKKSVS